jgi:hypothetical protein
MSRHTPWSKRKKLIESFFVEGLGVDMQCTSYRYQTNHSSYELPYYNVRLNREIIWEFPGKFITGSKNQDTRLPAIRYWLDNQCFASFTLDDYVSRPREELFDDLTNDQWELGDILRASDRRIGKAKLLEWAKTLPPENPALLVLAARFPRKERIA